MGILSKLSRDKKIITVDMMFSKTGEYSVRPVAHDYIIQDNDLIEVLCQFYVKTLYMVGRSPLGDFIISSFNEISRELAEDETKERSLIQVIRRIGDLLNLGFDIQAHLKINTFSFVSETSNSDTINHRIEVFSNRRGSRFIKTHPSAWQGQVYIPLALFALYNYVLSHCLRDDRESRFALAGCLVTLNEQKQIKEYHKTASLVWLSNYVDGYFRA